MFADFIFETDKYMDVSLQKELISGYAKNEKIKISTHFESVELSAEILSSLSKGDILIAANASALGDNFEKAVRTISLASFWGVSFYLIKEELLIDTIHQFSLSFAGDVFIKLSKGLSSLKNGRIQQRLKENGQKRGRPFKVDDKRLFDEKINLIEELSTKGLSKRQIAEHLEISETALRRYIAKYITEKTND